MRIIVLGSALILAGCGLLSPRPAPPPPVDAPAIAAVAEARAAQTGATLYDVDAQASDVRIYVFRGGRLPERGKNHVIAVRGLEGFVALHSARPEDGDFALGFRLDALHVDPPELRHDTGGTFAEEITDEQVEGTRANMLGESVLNAEQHPEVVLRPVRIQGDWPLLVLRVEVALHGRTAEYDTLVHIAQGPTARNPVIGIVRDVLGITPDEDSLVMEGALVVRHTDFGLEPMSVLGGLLALQDPLGIRFRVVARVPDTTAP